MGQKSLISQEGVEATRQAEIPYAYQGMLRELEETTGVVTLLEERLAPVMSIPPPRAEEKGEPKLPQMSAPLALELASTAVEIKAIKERLRAITSRLEI